MAAFAAMSLGLIVLVIGQGFSAISSVRFLEQVDFALLGVSILLGLIATLAVHMADWRSPESEEEFEKLVLHSEELAERGLIADPAEMQFMDLDPFDDADFEKLVRDALDDLPDLFLNTLTRVPVVISDEGWSWRAYGLYQGATVARDDVHDRIMIFRDTLRRDFGHDPYLLREQVTRVVRHELAHHVGFDEPGVAKLGL